MKMEEFGTELLAPEVSLLGPQLFHKRPQVLELSLHLKPINSGD